MGAVPSKSDRRGIIRRAIGFENMEEQATEGFCGGMLLNRSFLTLAVLFFVLSPGVLLRVPPRGGHLLVAAVHALVFALALRLVAPYTAIIAEGFAEQKMTNEQMKKELGLPATAAPKPAA